MAYPVDKDALLEFYISFNDLLSAIDLSAVNLQSYLKLPIQVGSHRVIGGDRFVRPGAAQVFAVNERLVDRVVEFGKNPERCGG